MSVFNPFFDIIARALAFFYEIRPSYGFAIIGLTLVVMIILTPLTLKGTRSMMMMQQLQPEMKKLQSKYKDDRQQLNEELMKFYRENNINPLGGCLPLLVQMPVFIVLYNVLRGLTLRQPLTAVGWGVGQAAVGSQLTTAPPVYFDPAHLPKDSQLYIDLSQTSTMTWGPLDLSESCSQALSQGVVHALPYILLIIVVGATGFIQQRQIQGRTPNAQINPQQQTIMKIMPVFLPVISFGLPSGLVLYFAVSNLYRIGQQWFISRSIYGIKRGEKPAAGGSDGGGKARDKSPKGGAGGGGAKNGDGGRGSSAKGTTGKPRGGPANGSGGARSKSGVATAKRDEVAKSQKTEKSPGQKPKTAPAPTPPAKKSAPSGDAARPAPTLQPRARKNKKR